MNSIQKAKWGDADGREIDLYTLVNRSSLVAKITNYGAIMVALDVPDRKGTMGDIVVGCDNLADFVKQTLYFGATVGRVGNRIADARFERSRLEEGCGVEAWADLQARDGPSFHDRVMGPVCRPRGGSRSIQRIARTQSGRERRLVNRSRPWFAVDQTAPRQ